MRRVTTAKNPRETAAKRVTAARNATQNEACGGLPIWISGQLFRPAGNAAPAELQAASGANAHRQLYSLDKSINEIALECSVVKGECQNHESSTDVTGGCWPMIASGFEVGVVLDMVQAQT